MWRFKFGMVFIACGLSLVLFLLFLPLAEVTTIVAIPELKDVPMTTNPISVGWTIGGSVLVVFFFLLIN